MYLNIIKEKIKLNITNFPIINVNYWVKTKYFKMQNISKRNLNFLIRYVAAFREILRLKYTPYTTYMDNYQASRF